MHYRLQKYLVEQFTSLIRRVFRYNSSWTNTDIELVQFASGSEQLAFEQFFEENERYPVITVGAQGGTFSHAAFNDLIDVYDYDAVNLGTRAQSSVTISDSVSLRVQIPNSYLTETIRGIEVYLASTGEASTDENITVKLYRNFTTSPVLVSSGSLAGTSRTSFDFHFCELWPYTTLTGEDYWVTLQTSSGSSYYVGLDTTATSLYSDNSSGGYVTATGSITGKLFLPAFIRMGGNLEPVVVIRCMGKNDTAGVYNLSELIAQYVELSKHSEISRASNAVDGTKLAMLQSAGVSELTEKGIYVKNIRIGGVDTRPRGENDKIFIIPITVEIFTEWFQDYPVDILERVEPSIQSFT